MKKTLFILIAFLEVFFFKAQNIAIGQWRTHLSYTAGKAVAESNDKIYYVSEGGIFALNKNDNSYELLSKVKGLSDAVVNLVNVDPISGIVIVTYSNSNIDIIQGGVITNISDIKRKNILGNKSINNIYFKDGYAFLACGFGIVVLDLVNNEIKDTYYIGTNGATVNVYEVTSNNTNFFAATNNGIYTALITGENLADFHSWSKMTGIPAGAYNTICFLNGNVYANYSRFITNGGYNKDTIFIYNGTNWGHLVVDVSGYVVKKINVAHDRLVVSNEFSVDVYDDAQTLVSRVNNYSFSYMLPAWATIDVAMNVWVADKQNGLVKCVANNAGEKYNPNGPKSNSVRDISIIDGKLWLAPGSLDASWNNSFSKANISSFIENSWSSLTGQQSILNLDTILDVISIGVDPNNSSRIYACTWGYGVLEINNGQITNLYNDKNSSLKNIVPGEDFVRIGAVAFDENENVWFTNSEVNSILSVRKKNGSWQSFDFNAFITAPGTVGQILVTKSGQKWMVFPRAAEIMVYNGGTSGIPSTANTKKLTSASGNGGIIGSKIYSIIEDQEGQIWIGTDKGIGVIFSPDNIFSGGSYDAQKILIEQDGHTQVLLETEIVTAIAIDGANRKWIGTQKSGVFLMSADGTKQINHFDESNSPLLSNEITTISVNGKTGEVFFGTTNGVISYRGTATEGVEDFEEVYAFPNPVKHDYAGIIAIKGLTKDAEVKITDVAGNLIYQTKAQGGQAIWDGNNFSGERAHTGVYLVYCANDDGTKTIMTKILFIN